MNYSKKIKVLSVLLASWLGTQSYAQCTEDLSVDISATEICLGEEVTLSATSTTGGIVTWDMDVVNGEAFTPETAGNITYTATSDNVDDCPAVVVVLVNALPEVAANATETAICAGNEITLTGSGAATYTWDLGVADGVAFAPAETATYEVTGTDIKGCVNTATVEVVVNELPTVNAAADFTVVCVGDEVVLTGEGAATYAWDLGVTDGVAFTPAATATYEVTGTDLNGCEGTSTIEVVVNELPTVEASADLALVCAGEEVVLTGAGAESYAWTDGVVDGVAFAATETTTYEVTGTDANGCENTATVEVVVNALPAVEASADATTICIGEEVVLTGAGAVSYTWTGGVVDGAAFAPTETATYEVTGTDANGCINTASIEINVNDPIVVATADATAICIGDEVVLTGEGAATYAWTGGVVDGAAFAPTETATYEVTGTDGNGCVATSSIEVVVNELPTVEASADLALVCAGEEVVLTGAGALSYAWTDGVVDGVAFAATETTTYEVTGTDANGCENTATVEVVVNALPTVEASADVAEICIGEEVVLTGAGAVSYAWTGGVVDGAAFAPTETATYEVTGTDANGCENTASIEVIVNNPIVVATADDASICIGDEVVLTGEGAATYAWTGGVVDGAAFAPTETATYEVTGTDINGCVNTATIEVVVNELPAVTATADAAAICVGDEVVLTGEGAATYVWTGGVVDGAAFAPTETATYEVTGTDINGCVGTTSSIEVVVNELPTVEASADLTEVCAGEEVVLTGAGALSYAWTEGVVDGVAFAATETTTYEVTGTDINGCVNTATIEVVVNALPEVIANADNVQICLGQELTLTGSGAESYAWDLEVVDGEAFMPEVIGFVTYTVVGTDVNGCVNTNSVEVETRDSVQITSVTTDEIFGDDGSINITVSGGFAPYTFDWDNDGTGDFDDTEDLTGLAGGTYVVVVEDEIGCSATQTVVIESQLSIEESTIEVGVYPNPTTDVVTISTEGTFSYEVITIDGAIIMNGVATNNQLIALGQYPTGVYFVAVKSANQTTTVKVVKK